LKGFEMSESQHEYKDMFGNDIKVGDYIVYGGLADRSAVLRAGRVVALTQSTKKVRFYDRSIGEFRNDYEPKIRCQSWNNFLSQDWGGKEKSGKQKDVSLGFFDRLIVVPEEIVSQKIKDDLAGE
jgi:hypothetical protein